MWENDSLSVSVQCQDQAIQDPVITHRPLPTSCIREGTFNSVSYSIILKELDKLFLTHQTCLVTTFETTTTHIDGIELELCDTIGGVKYQDLRGELYSDAHLVLFCCSIDLLDYFNNYQLEDIVSSQKLKIPLGCL